MEFFPALSPCPLQSLPTLAGVPCARHLAFLGVTFIKYPRADYLAFCETAPETAAPDPTFDSTVLVPRDAAGRCATAWPAAKLLPVDDPRAIFIDTLEYLQGNDLVGPSTLLPTAPTISTDASIGAGAIIDTGVQIDPGVTVGRNAVVRAGTWLKRGVIIGDNCTIGGVGINAYAGSDGRRRGFPHLAGVIVGERTSLGAGCIVVRGILCSTRIGANGIIGNLCNVAHGDEIGDDVWISIGTLIGGHTQIGNKATIAMGCTIRDNIQIGAHANIGMGSVVTKSVNVGASVFGNPARRVPAIKAGPSR